MQRWVPPASFDGYRILGQLGSGGMGMVYLGHDLLLDRQVAIKFIADEPDERREQRFLFEGRALARLIHPNVVLMFRIGAVEDRPFLVSEYVSGQSLDQHERPIPWRRVLDIGTGLARGLAAAHRAGILHRDVKPANAVVTVDGTVKLLDFGLAQLAGSDDAGPASEPTAAVFGALAATESDRGLSGPVTPPASASTSTAGHELRRPGAPAGTPRYMAPERLAGQPATRKSDLFSLGCVLHELSWGGLPGEPVQDPAQAVPPAFQAILEGCLAADPAQRFASVDAALEALEALADDTSASGELPAGNPYRGLQAFDASHRAVFLGRSTEVLAVVEKLRSDAVVVIAGDSGAGKSSLCRAGVLPWISEAGLHAGRGAVALSVVLGRDPLVRIAEAFAGFMGEPVGAPIDALRERMIDEPTEVARALARIAGDRTLVVFLDQIEELFTLAPAEQATAAARALAALARASGQLRVLATVRGDFLGRLAALPELGAEVARAPYLLRPLGPDKLREVIVGPARRSGVGFAPETVDELLRSSLSSEGSLPLLQFTLAELWEARDRVSGAIPASALVAIGGMSGALGRHADRVVEALAGSRASAARLLTRLVTPQRTRASLTERDLGELSPHDRTVLEALIAGRLVVVRGSETGATYELAHEALIARWSTLRQWLDEDAARDRTRQRLAAAAAEWERLGRRGDGLWRGGQLAGMDALDARDLASGERAFLAASRAARRRGQLLRVSVPAAIALAIAALLVGARLRADAEIAAAVTRKLDAASAPLAQAEHRDRESQRLRSDALLLFDQGNGLVADGPRETTWQRAEDAWARVLAESAAAASGYAEASSAIDAALVLDPSRSDVRTSLAHIITARLALAERLHQRELASELGERLSALHDPGAMSDRIGTEAVLAVRRVPPETAVSIARFVPDASGRLVLGPTALLADAQATLAPGSYLITATAPGRAAVRLPLVLARGQHEAIELALPATSAVPPGFVFVPGGASLVGSDEENLRVALSVSPMHPLQLASFLIGRFEVTFAEYIAWLDGLAPDEQALHAPRNRSRPGMIELRRSADQRWTLVFQPTTREYVAAWGEPIRYPGRAVRAEQDWRRFPVTGISFEDAQAFAAWLDRTGRVPHARMCREEEWERAARGADGRIYTTGRQLLPSEANFDLTYGGTDLAFGPDEVGSHPESASVFGVHDMVGNASEMVRTGRWNEQTAMRAASWYRERIQQRLDNRFRSAATARSIEMGFRLCADPMTP